MFELVLNALKFAVSADARNAAASIVDAIKGSPQWDTDNWSLEARIDQSAKENSEILRSLIEEKLKLNNFCDNAIFAFRLCFQELIKNAFEHGCSEIAPVVVIKLQITGSFIQFTIENEGGLAVDLEKILAEKRTLLDEDKTQERGRGLLIVDKLADGLKIRGASATVAIYADRVEIDVIHIKDMVVLNVKGGHFNPSLNRRFSETASKYYGRPMLINFSRYDQYGLPQSALISCVLRISKSNYESGHSLVICADLAVSTFLREFIPNDLIVDNLEDALDKLNYLDMLDTVQRSITY